MKDFTGKDVSIGDYVFYSTTGRRPESRLCKVVDITAKSVIVSIVKANRPNLDTRERITIRNDFAKVDYTE